MIVDTKLSLAQYMLIVNAIAEKYFDDNGNYVPHYGRLNAMRLFWNCCVVDHPLSTKLGHEISDADILEEIVADEEFVKKFEDEVFSPGASFNFAAAYSDALDIVDDKKSTIGRAITAFNKMDATLSPILTPDNIGAVRALIDNVNNGKIEPKVIDKVRSIFNK